MKRHLALALAVVAGVQPGLAAAAGQKTIVPNAPVLRDVPTVQLPVLPQINTAVDAMSRMSPEAIFNAGAPFAPKLHDVPTASKQALHASGTAQIPQAQNPTAEAQVVQASEIFDGAKSGKKQEAVAATAISAGGIALSAFIPGAAVLGPAAVETARLRNSPKPVTARSLKSRLGDYAETALLSLVFVGATAVAMATLKGGVFIAPALAAIWALAGHSAIENIAGLRSRVVGGWQASHDQRYRVGANGQLRDVRGHKYGEDRYDERAPGEVTPREQAVIRMLAVVTGQIALLMTSPSPSQAVLYGLLMTAASLLSWRNASPYMHVAAREHDR